MTGLPISTLNDWERGRTMPRLDQLEQVAKGLNCRIRDLFWSSYQ